MVSDEPPRKPLPQVGTQPTLDKFAAALRELWEWTGLTLDGLRLPSSTSHDFLNGLRPANVKWLDAFVMRCLTYGKERQWLPTDFDVHAELDKWRIARAHVAQQSRSAGRVADNEQPDSKITARETVAALGSFAATIVGAVVLGAKAGKLANKTWDWSRTRRQ
jgi:hypothetical protein